MDLWPIRAYQRLSWNFDLKPVGKAGMAGVADSEGTYETAGCPLPGPCLGWGIASEVITWEGEWRWMYSCIWVSDPAMPEAIPAVFRYIKRQVPFFIKLSS